MEVMMAIRITLMIVFIAMGVALTGPGRMELKGFHRFLTGFGIFAGMNVISGIVFFVVGLLMVALGVEL